MFEQNHPLFGRSGTPQYSMNGPSARQPLTHRNCTQVTSHRRIPSSLVTVTVTVTQRFPITPKKERGAEFVSWGGGRERKGGIPSPDPVCVWWWWWRRVSKGTPTYRPLCPNIYIFFFLRDTKFAPKKSISTRRNRHTYGCSRYAAIQLCFCFLVPRSTQFPLYPVGWFPFSLQYPCVRLW